MARTQNLVRKKSMWEDYIIEQSIPSSFRISLSSRRMENCQTGHLALEMSPFAVNVKCSQFQPVGINPLATQDLSLVNWNEEEYSDLYFFLHWTVLAFSDFLKERFSLEPYNHIRTIPSHLAKHFHIISFKRSHAATYEAQGIERCSCWTTFSKLSASCTHFYNYKVL